MRDWPNCLPRRFSHSAIRNILSAAFGDPVEGGAGVKVISVSHPSGSTPAGTIGSQRALALSSIPLLISTHAGVTIIYHIAFRLRFSATADKSGRVVPPPVCARPGKFAPPLKKPRLEFFWRNPLPHVGFVVASR